MTGLLLKQQPNLIISIVQSYFFEPVQRQSILQPSARRIEKTMRVRVCVKGKGMRIVIIITPIATRKTISTRWEMKWGGYSATLTLVILHLKQRDRRSQLISVYYLQGMPKQPLIYFYISTYTPAATVFFLYRSLQQE